MKRLGSEKRGGTRDCLSIREHRNGSRTRNSWDPTPTTTEDEWEEMGQDRSRKD